MLKTAGSRGVAAADGGVSGSATVSVAPAATTHLDVTSTAGSPQTAGGAFALTVTAQDDFGNTTPAYTGTVHLQSDDAQAVLPADYAFVAGDNGSHSFPVVLRTAGARAAGAVDTGDASIAGTTAVTVAAAAADHLTITTDAANPQTAGDAASATVTARDAYGNVDTAYTGTVSFTSNDAVATVPGDYAFTGADAGTHTFTGGVTFRTVGARTVSAADAAHGTISGASPVVTVGPAAISSFRVTATSTAPTAGVADALTITALDPFGNVATGYTGDHVLVFDGAQASTAPVTQPTVTDKAGSAQALGTPATVTFTNGVSSAGGSLVAYKAETAMVTVDDGAHSNGAGLMLHVAPAGATKLAIDVNNGMTPTAGSPFPVIGTALDDFGNASAVTAPTDVQVTRNAGTGTVGGTLTGTIPLGASQVTLGGVTYSKAEGGVQLTLARTSGDNLVSADSATFTVSSIADRLVVATVNGGTTPSAGTPFSVVVRAEDANHNASTPVVDTTFALSLAAGTGTLGGTLTGTLPAGQTQVTVSGLTYTKAEGGVQLAVTRTAGDTLLAGTSATFAVAPGAANRFAIVGSGTQTAGTPNQLTITAYDANGNIATGYAGAHALTFGGANSLGAHAATVTDNGGSAVDFGTPATITFTNGVSTAGGSLVLYRVENAIVTATAGAVSTTGSDRLPVAVDAAATATLDVASSASSPQTAGAAFDVTVTARDTYGNLTPAYVGGVTFTSNDAQAVLPGAFTFGAADNGTHTFTGVTLKTAGTKTVTVTDSGNATITGSASATVAPAGASALRLTGSPTQTAGTAQTVTVTVLDQFGNTATAYTGGHAVTFAGAADSPSPATHPTVDTIALGTPTTLTFTNGTATGSLKLFAAGNPTLTATAGALTTTGSDRLGVSVAHAALAKLALTLSSPQVNGAAFTGANTIAAEDPYGNIVDSFDAATDNVTLTTSGGLTGTLSGADVLSHAGDFVSGIADLSSLGLTYTGAAATGTLQAATQSGSTGSATLTVTGGTATKLVVTGSGTETAGQAQQLTITAQDASGNTSQSYTGDHALTFGGASAAGATQPTVSDKNGTAVAFGSPTTTTFTNGVASAGGSLTLYKAENAVVTATDGALTTTGSDRLAVSITAAQPSGSASAIAAAPASRTADGTSASTVTVTARDTFGNPLTTGGATVVFNTDRGSLGATTDNNNGTYSGSLTSTTAGTAHVTATIDAGAVAGSATVTFLPDTVSASHTTVVASSGTASTDGGTATITVTVKDANDNAVANAHVTLDQGAGTSAGISPTPLAGADTDANGVATFTVSDTVAEAAVFSATASSLLVTQTAGVTFLPGTANAGHSLLSATPLSLVAGSSSAITVRARDAHDNDLTSGGASVVLATTLGSIGAVTDHGNGTYTATLTSTSAGTADVTGTIDGAPIGAAAVNVAFDPGAADASQTTISASPSTINADGSSGTSTITARAKDAYGNDLATGGATVTLATTKGSLGSVTDNGNGTYSATLTATGQSGTAHVTGQLGGTAIGGAADVTLTPPVPVVAIDGGIPAGQTTASTVTVTFHSPNDDGNTTFDCRLDGGAFAPCVSPKTYSGLADGSHTFRVRGVNGNGAGVAVSGSWTVDSTGPTVHVTTAPGAYTNNVTETLAATASDATTSVAGVDFLFGSSAATCPAGTLISTDTTPNGAGEYTATWTTPADGSYAVCAVAHDPLGNASAAPDTSAVVVDRTKPVASLPAFGTVVGPTTYVRGNRALHASALDATSGVDTVDFSFSGATSGSIDHLAGAGTPNTNDSYDTSWNTTALADGPYTVALIARDKATNADTQTRDIVVDNTAPSISVDDPGAFGNGTISLSVTASDAGSGLDSSSIVVESSPHGAATWTPIADPAAWTPADGNYDLRATAKDNVGNQATSATRTILVDNTAPTVSDDADSAWHNTDVTVTLGAADAESGVASVEYKVDGAGSWTTGTAVTIPSTAGDGPHTITYRATNRAGVASTPRTATVKIDASTPSAGQPVVAPIATYARGTIDLSATVSDAASGIASGYPTFRIAPAATPETTPASNCPNWGSAAPAHFDTTSVADGNYALRTIAVDNATNGICSSVATATSLTIDNTAPATVAQNVPLATQNQDVTVTLDATDNLSGVQSTEYRVDHGPWTTGTTVVIPASSNHSNDGLHTIDYFSTDRAGNAESAQTAQVAIDTTGPSGSATDPSNILTGTVLLTASPTEPDIKTVQWLYRPTGSTGAYTPVGPADTAAPWQTNWITSGVFDGDYDLEVVFTDTTGNQTTQALSTKTIDNTAPDSATVTAPVANAVRSGTIALGSTAHDATSGIDSARTQFEVKATGDSAFVPVSGTSWNSTTKPDGPVQVHVAVWDRAGNGPIYSSPVTFTVDNTAPTVSLSAPAVAGTSASLSATGSADIATVDFEVSPHGAATWTHVATANGPFTATWTPGGSTPDGLYDVRATATDLGSHTGTDVKTVRVDQTAPTGSIAQPAAGTTVGGPDVVLHANADGTGSSVADVKFQYRALPGGTFVDAAGASTPPFKATWNTTALASGDYELRAIVTDAAGNTFTSAATTVTVDSTPPGATFTVQSPLHETADLSLTTADADATSVVYAVSPAGAGTWTQIASSTHAPDFGGSFATGAFADGDYDVRATISDGFGNTTQKIVPNVRIDNTAPALASSTPADGSMVASANSISAVATEPIASITALRLDTRPVTFTPTLSGAALTFPTGPLAPGEHVLRGWLVDVAGNSMPFRINITVGDGSTTMPATSKNVSTVVPTTLTSVDNNASVIVPTNVWQQPVPTPQDFLVLHVQPVTAATVATGSMQAQAVVDVRMTWDLTGEEEHHFDAPLQVDLSDPTGGRGVPATTDGGDWRMIQQLDTPGTLPASWQDGYWRENGLVHILTRHLSQFAILDGTTTLQLAPPRDFAGAVATDGLTLRWAAGIPDDQLASFSLYANGTALGSYGPREYEAKLGQVAAENDVRYTLTETNTAGNESDAVALRVAPPVAGLGLDAARAALAARGFKVGKVTTVAVPTVAPGTVVGPTAVSVQPEGTAIDLQVAGTGSVRSGLAFSVANAPRMRATSRTVFARVLLTAPARVDVTLDAKPYHRIQRWHFLHVPAGASVLRLHLAYPLPAGGYDLYWMATADADKSVQRELTPLQNLGKRARLHVAGTPQIVTVADGRHLQAVDRSHAGHVETLSSEETFVYATFHDVSAIVVDADREDVAIAASLRTVFPGTATVVVSTNAAKRSAAARAGALTATPATLASVLRRALSR